MSWPPPSARSQLLPRAPAAGPDPAHDDHPAHRDRLLRPHLLLPALQRHGGAAPPGRALDGRRRASTRGRWCCAPGCTSPSADLVKILNGLNTSRARTRPAAPGRVHGGQRVIVLARAPRTRRRADRWSPSTKDRVKEMRGLRSKQPYPHADARARADHLPLRREPREAAAGALRGAARAPDQGGAGHRGPPLLQPPRARPVPHRRAPPSATSGPRATSRAAARSPSSWSRTSS